MTIKIRSATADELPELRRMLVDPDPEADFGLLVGLYRQYRENRTGDVHRGKPMWDASVLAPVSGELIRTALVYEEEGEHQGYCLYRTGPGPARYPEPDQLCLVDDLVWLNPRAYRAFWENFSRMP